MVLSVHPGSVIGEKVLYVGSSISYHCDFDVLRNEIGAEVITRKAYGTVFDRNARFPDKNFSTVLQREVSVLFFNFFSTCFQLVFNFFLLKLFF